MIYIYFIFQGIFSISDIGSDGWLSIKYLLGTNYRKIVNSRNDPSVQPWKIQILWITTDEENNICEELEFLESGEIPFDCFEKDFIFGLLTLSFLFIPGHMLTQIIYGFNVAQVLSFSYFVLSILVLLIISCSTLVSAEDITDVGDILAVLIFIFLVFFAALQLSSAHKAKSSQVSTPYFGNPRPCSELRTLWGSMTLAKFITFPAIIALTPLIIILFKMRVIFPYNENVKIQKLTVSLSETLLEATPQLCLQLYIIFTRLDRTISPSQWFVMASALLAMSHPKIEDYLLEKGKPATLTTVLSYLPLFLLANIFKVLAISLVFVFFSFFWTIILFFMISYIYNYFMKLIIDKTSWVNNHPGAVKYLCYQIFYIVILLIILILNNVYPGVQIFDPLHWDFIIWKKLPIVESYSNPIILVTISVSFFSIFLDYVYSCFGCGVFIFNVASTRRLHNIPSIL